MTSLPMDTFQLLERTAFADSGRMTTVPDQVSKLSMKSRTFCEPSPRPAESSPRRPVYFISDSPYTIYRAG